MSPILLMAPDGSVTFTATVVIAGVFIVVGVLLLLILVFYAFGMMVSKAEQRGKKKAEQKSAQKASHKASVPVPPVVKAPVAVPPSAPMQVEPGISGEVVAAIAAAVAVSEGPGATVRAIKKKNVSGRNPWAFAAVSDNTRPF